MMGILLKSAAYQQLHRACDLYTRLQERPVTEEVRKDRPAGQAGKEVHAVRLGVGDRSYLVRDKQIEVLKNVYGGVQVCSHLTCAMFCLSILPPFPHVCAAVCVVCILQGYSCTPKLAGDAVKHDTWGLLTCVMACRAPASPLT